MRFSIRKQTEPTPRPLNCLNCGVAVPPESVYCGQCGQENEASPVSFAALMREAWEEFAKVDKKLLATLTALLFRPGYLTDEYVRGRRAAYLSPFKMYITVSALFFLVWGLIVPFDKVNDLEREVEKAESQIKRSAKGAPAKPDANIAASNLNVRLTSSDKQGKNDPVSIWRAVRAAPIKFFGNRIAWNTLPATVSEYREKQSSLSLAERDRPVLHYLKERLIRFSNDPADSAKSLFSTGLPFMLLIQLPLFAVWMRLIYFRQRRLYVEHLVFVLHTHTFFFLLCGTIFAADAVVQSLGTAFPESAIPIRWVALALLVTLYNVVAYRRFYRQGWGKTLVKGWFLLNGYFFLFLFTAGIAALFAVLWTLFAPT